MSNPEDIIPHASKYICRICFQKGNCWVKGQCIRNYDRCCQFALYRVYTNLLCLQATTKVPVSPQGSNRVYHQTFAFLSI